MARGPDEGTAWGPDGDRRDGWRERLRLLARRRINAIMIGHPHPFPAFIDYPQAPEAEYFPAEVVERNAETLRWLITESAEYGVRLCKAAHRAAAGLGLQFGLS